MYRILITGSNGLVGGRLAKCFNEDQIFTISGSSELDLREQNLLNLYIKKIKPEIVIHCAALANVEKCESEKQLANDSNIKATSNLLNACKGIVNKFIYISTDLVFENQVAPTSGFRESDLTSTYSHYAHTKLVGESLAFASDIPDVSICRLSLALDLHPNRGYLCDIINKLEAKQSINLYDNEFRTPLLVEDFGLALRSFIKLYNSRNIFHVAGLERLSRYELGLKIAKVWSLNSELIIKNDINSHKGLVPRAKDVSLNSSKFWKFTGHKPTALEEGLVRIKKQLFTS